jgi:hypothetical protein
MSRRPTGHKYFSNNPVNKYKQKLEKYTLSKFTVKVTKDQGT